MSHLHHQHDTILMILSVLVAICASFTALDLSNAVTTVKGKIRWYWLGAGSVAMGLGIWSMHFVGMLAYKVEGIVFYYDIPTLGLSIATSVLGSVFSLLIASTWKPTFKSYVLGTCLMGATITSMHFLAIRAMTIDAVFKWNYYLVFVSITIALIASCLGFHFAFLLRKDFTTKGFVYRALAAVILGAAVSGMHYTAMAAMHLYKAQLQKIISPTDYLAGEGIGGTVIIFTLIVLGIALTGSHLERAILRKQQEADSLKSSVKIRDHFLSLASHEIKAPLTSIMLQNDLILRSIKQKNFDLNKLEAMLRRTGQNVDRIRRLVDDMLDLSRVDSGKLNLQKEEAELTEIVTEVIERLLPILESVGCTVHYKFEETFQGHWDRFRLEQVFTNILTNASKYAPGAPVDVSIQNKDEHAMVSIRDHGKGISQEFREKIFDKFERAKNEGDSKGLGLGLFISREIIHLHEGKIHVESWTGEGAEFQIFLPVLPRSQIGLT